MGRAPCHFRPLSVALSLLLGFGSAGPVLFQVLAPSRPLSTLLGGTVELPCHLSPALSAQDMQVTWSRPQLGQNVLVYWPDRSEEQGAVYQGRAELITQGLAHGNISLRIWDVRLADAGQYQCEVRSTAHHASNLLELSVTAFGSDPVLHMTGSHAAGVNVSCLSAGWHPEPHMLWRNGRGEVLHAELEEKLRCADGLFNVSSSMVVAESSDPTLTCTIRASDSGPEAETTVRITGLFPRQAPEMTASLLLLVLSISLGPLAVYLHQRLRALRGEAAREHKWREFLNEVALAPAEVTLDPITANPFLVLSAGGRSVMCSILWHEVPKSDRRFDPLPGVLASQGFTAGQHYWDVEVGRGGDWAIGVVRDSIERQREFLLCPDMGVWALQCQEGKWSALTCPRTPLWLESAPTVVRVHLDCKRRSVAFYNVEGMAHIFTFSSCSQRALFPFFLLWASGTELTILPPGQSQAEKAERARHSGTPKLRERQGSLTDLLITPGQT
ncbi:butyrophilin subfamily 1 member A1-like isoform X2 [Carettochelys insculpta]|uniref:butyrophilin subfamily 1 member A1-like isoform X2 n=1 Tax=Carettochelys insculpta TaxID=44489 RepID=UPI003EC12C7A